MSERSELVYVSGLGRVKQEKPKAAPPAATGAAKVALRRLGGGKVASVVSGLGLGEAELKALCSECRKKFGAGGTVKDFTIELQGDRREALVQLLASKGYKAKLSGG